MIKDSDRYIKIVEWSEADNCYLGSAPGLIEYCCHGTDEKKVFEELCLIVDEWIELLKQEHKSLPPSYKASFQMEKNLSNPPVLA